mgnify:CR=1 FL=1
MLAAIGFVGMIQAKNYVGMAIIVVIVLVSIWFNNVRLQSILSKTLVEPIKNLVVASEKISSGDFEIGVPYEAEDELGELSDSFETAAADDKSAPLMDNAQKVYAGMTYGRGRLTESFINDDNRGFLA